MKQLNFSQAMDGYFLFAHARHLSERTLDDYRNTFRKFSVFVGDEVFVNEKLAVTLIGHTALGVALK